MAGPGWKELIALAAAYAIAVIANPAGISGAVLLLPFQVSVLGTPSPAVTPTNLLYNVVATPGALYRYRRQHQTGGRLAVLLTESAVQYPDRPAVRGIPALARRPQGGQRLNSGGVERRPGVQRGQRPVPQRQPQPPRDAAADGRVRRVLRELHDDPVPVPAERVVLLGVGVLPEPAR